MLNCLKFHNLIHDTTASMHQQVPCTRKNDILGSWLIACCKLAPTLARQIWRHNDVIGCNEYLISILSESPFLGYIHCIFCLNPQIIHGDMKENVSGCFFLNTVYTLNICCSYWVKFNPLRTLSVSSETILSLVWWASQQCKSTERKQLAISPSPSHHVTIIQHDST